MSRPVICPVTVGGFDESMQHLSVMRAFALVCEAISAGWCGGCFFGETGCRGVVAEPFPGAFVELGGDVGDVGG